jgi:hypothetical protein
MERSLLDGERVASRWREQLVHPLVRELLQSQLCRLTRCYPRSPRTTSATASPPDTVLPAGVREPLQPRLRRLTRFYPPESANHFSHGFAA